MNAKEIRKLQRNKRSQPARVREAISFANACAFSKAPRNNGIAFELSEDLWSKRWSEFFAEATARFEKFTDGELRKFLGLPE